MNDIKGLVSVIIPYYKHQDYIFDTINSVLAQTYYNVELIVVDDGSCDGMAKEISEHANLHKYSFYEKDNGGGASAVNFGILKAKGEFISVIGSDDIMAKNRIERQIFILDKMPWISACASNVIRIDKNGNEISRDAYQSEEVGIETLYSNAFYYPGPSVTYRKSALKHVNYFSLGVAIEDWDMYLKLASNGLKLYRLEDALTYYRVHDNTSSNYFKMYQGILVVANKFRKIGLLKYIKIVVYQKLKYIYKSILKQQYKTAIGIFILWK